MSTSPVQSDVPVSEVLRLATEATRRLVPGFSRVWSLFDDGVLVIVCGRLTNYTDIDEEGEGTYAQNIIGGLAAACGVQRIFVPSVRKSNALVLGENQLPLIETQRWNGVPAHIGGEVDGVRLVKPWSAALFRTADCPTCVVKLPDKTVVGMHAGLRSLVRWGDPDTFDPNRQHESVIAAAVLEDFDPMFHRDTKAALLCGICSEHFLYPSDHPTYGPSNMVLHSHLREKYGPKTVDGDRGKEGINFRELVRIQLEQLGVPVNTPGVFTTDDICTFSDRSTGNDFGMKEGEHLLFSHARFVQEGGTDSKHDWRNAILVIGRG